MTWVDAGTPLLAAILCVRPRTCFGRGNGVNKPLLEYLPFHDSNWTYQASKIAIYISGGIAKRLRSA